MLSPIKTNLSQKLQDKDYRHQFFKGRAQLDIAYNLRRFRKARGFNQSKLAQLCEMKQSAVSRAEQASYSSWNLKTLWRIAEALDVRVSVQIEDMKDVLREYGALENVEASLVADRIIENQVFHMDLKPSNVIIGDTMFAYQYGANVTAETVTAHGRSEHIYGPAAKT